MNDIRKVPASAGAEWLLGGFGLLRKAPLGLGLLGVLYGLLTLLVAASVRLGTGAFMLLELAMVLAGPLLMGGIAWAVRDVDQGGRAEPSDLLQGFRGGRAGRLLLTLLPNIGAVLVCLVLLYAMIGGEALTQVVTALERASATGGNPDPDVFTGFPFDRFALWLLLSLVIGVTAGFFTFVAIPEIMFTGHSAFTAMGRSFRACVRNLPAVLLLIVLMFIAVIAISIGVNILTALIGFAIGQAAALFVGQLLMMAVLMPVMAGTIYHAWRQMLGDAPAPPVVTPAAGGFEA